eukprot:Em0498g3a
MTLHAGYHHEVVRAWQTQNSPLSAFSFVYPVFVSDIADLEEEVASLPGQKRYGVNKLKAALEPLVKNGLKAILIFGVPTKLQKDARGSVASDPGNPTILAIKEVRAHFKDLLVACDVCLCAYTDHGHCGLLCPDGSIDNKASIQRLAEVALAYAEAGCCHELQCQVCIHLLWSLQRCCQVCSELWRSQVLPTSPRGQGASPEGCRTRCEGRSGHLDGETRHALPGHC